MPELNGLWPEVLPKALERNNVMFYFGTYIGYAPMSKADVEFLFKSVCRDEVLIRLCANMIVEYRRLQGGILPARYTDTLTDIVQHMKSKGRLI